MKHGGDLTQAMAQYGGTPAMWLDLSTGINPRPWPIPAPLPDTLWQRLPSRADQDALIAAARMAYNVPAGVEIAAASGSQALIQWLPHLTGPGAVANHRSDLQRACRRLEPAPAMKSLRSLLPIIFPIMRVMS